MTTQALQSIRLVIFDVDGVLTDGMMFLSTQGEEFLGFDVQDGFGIKALLEAGITVAVITGRDVEAVKIRCRKLGIRDVQTGVERKLPAYRSLRDKLNLNDDQIAFVGDDIPDLGPMKACGFPIAVANARPEILDIAAHRTNSPGGRGAAREVSEMILKAQGKWGRVLNAHCDGEAR